MRSSAYARKRHQYLSLTAWQVDPRSVRLAAPWSGAGGGAHGREEHGVASESARVPDGSPLGQRDTSLAWPHTTVSIGESSQVPTVAALPT